MAEAKNIDPANIEPSPHNPRLVFDKAELERLRESIDEVGILVPLTVYQTGDDRYRLIDGERRLKCALELGLDQVPCYVVEGVAETEELEWMFSIHMMREEWDDGPVAKALKDLADQLGGWDDETMKAVTGMSGQRLTYFKALADAPDEILERVIAGDLPANLVADSILRVAKPLRNELPELLEGREDKDFVRAMVEKRDAGKLPDVVDIRDLRTMIRVAAEDVASEEEAGELKEAIRRVIGDPQVTIEDVYEDTVATRIAAETFLTAIERFKKSATHVVREVSGDPESTHALAERLESLVAHLQGLLSDLRADD